MKLFFSFLAILVFMKGAVLTSMETAGLSEKVQHRTIGGVYAATSTCLSPVWKDLLQSWVAQSLVCFQNS